MLDNIKPVWQRSRNITQMPGVMPGTAIEASVKNSKMDGSPYKCQATDVKLLRSGGSATASLTVPIIR